MQLVMPRSGILNDEGGVAGDTSRLAHHVAITRRAQARFSYP